MKFQEKKKANAAKDKKPNKKTAKNVANPPKRKKKPEGQGTKPSVEPQKDLVANDDFTEGKKIQVKLGASPVAATIVETSKNEVSVQLASGMVMKVSKENIFQA